MKDLKKFKIFVKQLVPDDSLDYDDRCEEVKGVYIQYAKDREEALNKFHSTVPIACLDDFDIIVKRFHNRKDYSNLYNT